MKGAVALGVRSVLLAALLACSAPQSSAAAMDADTTTREFDEYLARGMRTWGVPGVAIALVREGKLVAVKGYGVRTIGEPARVDAGTLFAIASVTKSFTAGVLAMLVDEHKMGWDDPVRKYLPSLEVYDPQVTATMTVRDLLAQRTGLGDRNLLTWNSPYSHDEILRRMRYLKPACTFRDRFEYSNLNFLLAGDVAAVASGRSWQDLVEERIFRPLNMSSSTTSTARARESGNLATPHIKIGGRLQKLPLFDEGPSAAAGSIHSTAADMARWLAVQLGEGQYGTTRLWSVEVDREMHTAQIPVRDSPVAAVTGAQFSSYGFGWYVYDWHGHKVLEHDGQSDGMHALIAMIPDAQLGIVVLTNTSLIGLPNALALHWFEEGLNLETHDWISELHRKLQPVNDSIDPDAVAHQVPRIPNTHASLAPAGYAGTYHDELLGDLVVAAGEDGNLRISLLGRTGRAGHWHYDTFRMDWQGDLYLSLAEPFITFSLRQDGTPGSVTLASGDRFAR
jgi:CubicO group peptidase (beta-lactamase class C family)